MHIILGLLGTIVTILVLFKRLSDAGIDIGWLNPFAWQRRRQWRKKMEASTVFSLNQPLEIAAMLALSVAKIDGEISKQEKAILLSLFQAEFGKTEKEASDLLLSSVFIFGDGQEALAKPAKVINSAIDQFSEEQAKSVMTLLETIKKIDDSNSKDKAAFIAEVEKTFDKHFNANSKW